jgi:Bax protein
MQVNENRLAARLGVAWPGIVAVLIAGFWLGLWASLVPSPVSLGSAAGYASLLKPKEIAFVPSVVKLRQLFVRIDYDLDSVRSGDRMVPPLYLASVPRGMRNIEQPAERKQVFLRMMLPLVLKANEGVRAERNRLLRMKRAQDKGVGISDDDRVYLKHMAKRYGVRKPRIDLLLARVDVLPVSIALAQSAIESGWGTSRFVLEGNAPFGQWTTASFKGLVPKDRTGGETHKIRAFDDLYDSVRSYIHNLNTHRAYRRFRAIRETMRASGARLDSLTLISSLKSYSAKGDDYVKLLKNVIVVNQLEPLDRARLAERMPRGESGV